jgi:hypothetical protein
MTLRNPSLLAAILALATLTVLGCARDTSGLRPVAPDDDPLIFGDTFGQSVDFQAFLGSKLDAVSIDGVEVHSGTASLKVTVPAPGAEAGGYAGGAFVTAYPRDLSSYDALTFWAKASKDISLDVAGLGNDNTGTSKYEASRSGIHLGTTWTKVIIPIPLPEKLTEERGLFFFAEGPEGTGGSTMWFDEVTFEKTGLVTNPQPAITPKTVGAFVGATVTVSGTYTDFDVDGTEQTIDHSPGYFTFSSSNDTVATVVDGEIHAVGTGTAFITGRLDTVEATGKFTINVTGAPTTPAPTPTLPASDVISLFSDAYNDVPVDTWSATWDQADVTDFTISGNAVKAYTNLIYAGIEFATNPIDATEMTDFHLDVWLPQGNLVKVKLVDFGADGIYGGGDDKEQELTFNAGSTPPLSIGVWSSLDIPLADYNLLTSRAHLAQIILSSDSKTVYVDNVYFHR